MVLPDLPTEQMLEERDDMIKTLSSVNSMYQNSCFYIPSDNDADVQHGKECFMSVIQGGFEGYVPKELLWQLTGAKDTGKSKAMLSSPRRVNIDISLTRIEELARREGQAPLAGGDDTLLVEGKDQAGEDEREDGYDEDDVFGNDDDPFQQYDDDEEYDDPDDDGGGDAYF